MKSKWKSIALTRPRGDDAARLRRQRVGIHRERLTELERGSFQLAERPEDPLRRLAQVGRRLSAELAAGLVREEVARGSRREVRQPAQPAEPAGLDVIVVGHPQSG